MQGESVGDLEVSDAVFNVDYNKQVIYDIIKAENANQRQGNAATKSRGMVSGGGSKPWRQKGTGRARQGTIRATQWVGGGIPFGPKPRDLEVRLPKKVKHAAYRAILSLKANEGKLMILDSLQIDAPKTSYMSTMLRNFKFMDKNQKITILVSDENKDIKLASRNIPNLTYLNVQRLSGRSLFYNKMILGTEDAIKKLEEMFQLV